MQRIRPLEVVHPATVAEALERLAAPGRVLLVAGGSDLVPKLKRGQFAPDVLVSLDDIEEMKGLAHTGGSVRIGALTRLAELEGAAEIAGLTALREAVSVVATPIIRNMATIGGNLLQDTRCRYYDRSTLWREAIGSCLKLDADACRVASGGNRCFATLCSDLAPALIVLDAEATLAGRRERRIPLEELYSGDGKNPFRLQGEILTHIDIPSRSVFSRYRKLRMRDSFDFPEVGVAVSIADAGDHLDVSVALTAVDPGIPVFRDRVSRERLREMADTVFAGIKPMDTLFFPPAHRKSVARNFLVRIFDEFLAPR